MKKNFQDVLSAVCKYHSITPKELLCVSRKRNIVEKRMVFIYLCFTQVFNFKLLELQDFIDKSGRGECMNHASLIHSKKTVSNLMITDVSIRKEISDIREIINTDIAIVVKDICLLSICRSYSTTVLSA